MTGLPTKEELGFSHRSLTEEEYKTRSGWQVGTFHRGSTSSATRVPDLQNLPEDPVVRPMLISNGVPRNLWPEGVISLKQAEALVSKYGAQSTTDGKQD